MYIKYAMRGALIGWFVLYSAMGWAAPAPVYSLKQALTQAINHNPSVLEAVANEQAAKNRANVARAALLPRVRAQASWGVDQQDAVNRVTTRHPRTQEIVASQPLTLGEEWLTWQAAKAEYEAQQARAASVIQNVILNVIATYSDILVAQDRVKGLNELVKNLSRQRYATRREFEEGQNTRTGMALAGSRLANAKADLQRAQNSLQEAQAKLSSYVVTDIAVYRLQWPKPIPYKAGKALVHPRIKEAAALLLRAQRQRRNAMVQVLPDISLNASTGQTHGNSLDSVGRQTSQLTINLSVPLFEGGKNIYGVDVARNEEEAAQRRLEDAEQSVKAERVAAKSNLTATRSILQESQRAQKEQAIAIKGARLEYQNGERSLTQLLDAEQEYIQTDLNFSQARREALFAVPRLKAALGAPLFP